jgi:DNA repair protein RecO (recombination protein O)
VPIPRRYTTDAIVLSRFDFGEADRILTLITPGSGKLKAIAKGIRRPTSRIGGSLEPFAELNVALARGRTFEVVTQVSVGPRVAEPARLARERATGLVPRGARRPSLEERHAAEPIYTLLKHAYGPARRGHGPGPRRPLVRDAPRRRAGRPPEVDRCAGVRPDARATERYRWWPASGGVVCERCPGPSHTLAGLSLEG